VALRRMVATTTSAARAPRTAARRVEAGAASCGSRMSGSLSG
jgi:hypothetical protein